MAKHPLNDELCALTNQLSIEFVDDLLKQYDQIDRRYGRTIALTICVDAALASAIALLETAVLRGHAPSDFGVAATLHARLDRGLAAPSKVHVRRPDGSFGPDQSIN